MKFSTVAVLSAATVAYGQSISDLPSCALNCFIGPLQSDGCKSLTDFKCHCSKPDLLPKVVPCVQNKCPADVAADVAQQAVALCKANGVDITVPGSEPTTSAAASSSKAPESSYPTGAQSSSMAESTYVSVTPTKTFSTYPAPTNGTMPPPTTTPIPTGAANKATFGGAVAVAAGVAALAGL